MKKIGRGLFTTAYLQDDGKVLLKSNDPVKECMACGYFPNCYLFPEITVLPNDDYIMDYYGPTVALKPLLEPRQYRLYKELNKINKLPMSDNPDHSYSVLKAAFENIPDEFAKEKEYLLYALSGVSKYGSDVWFECTPRNVRPVNGKLLLLDCFLLRKAVMQAKQSKFKPPYMIR